MRMNEVTKEGMKEGRNREWKDDKVLETDAKERLKKYEAGKKD